MKAHITLTQLESAINFWRAQSPATGDELRLCPQVCALAHYYAQMILSHEREIPEQTLSASAREAFDAWHTVTNKPAS